MRISDWSSDVCSSDLSPKRKGKNCNSRAMDRQGAPGEKGPAGAARELGLEVPGREARTRRGKASALHQRSSRNSERPSPCNCSATDPQSDGLGTRVSIREDIGWSNHIKKKTKT